MRKPGVMFVESGRRPGEERRVRRRSVGGREIEREMGGRGGGVVVVLGGVGESGRGGLLGRVGVGGKGFSLFFFFCGGRRGGGEEERLTLLLMLCC